MEKLKEKIKKKIGIILLNIVYIYMLYPLLLLLLCYICLILVNALFTFPVAYAEFGTIKLTQLPEPLDCNHDFNILLQKLNSAGLTEIQSKAFLSRLNEKYRHFYLTLDKNESISDKFLLKFHKDIFKQTKPFTKNLTMKQLNIIIFESTLWFDNIYSIPEQYQYSSQLVLFQRKEMLYDIQWFSLVKYPHKIQILLDKFRDSLIALHINNFLVHKISTELSVILNTFIENSKDLSPQDRIILYYNFIESISNYLDNISRTYYMDNFVKFFFKSYSNNLSLIFHNIGFLYKFNSLIADIHYSHNHTFHMFNELQSLFYYKYELVSKNLWTSQDQQVLLDTMKYLFFKNSSVDKNRIDIYLQYEPKFIEFFEEYCSTKNSAFWQYEIKPFRKHYYPYKLFNRRIYG